MEYRWRQELPLNPAVYSARESFTLPKAQWPACQPDAPSMLLSIGGQPIDRPTTSQAVLGASS